MEIVTYRIKHILTGLFYVDELLDVEGKGLYPENFLRTNLLETGQDFYRERARIILNRLNGAKDVKISKRLVDLYDLKDKVIWTGTYYVLKPDFALFDIVEHTYKFIIES